MRKSDLEAIEQLIRLSLLDKFGKVERGACKFEVHLSGLEKWFEAGLADFANNLESIRDVLSE
jgi:hypothetical protein